MNYLRKVIVKTMTVNRTVDDVFDFFEDVKKSMEIGGAAKSIAKGADGWWTFDHVVAGREKMKHVPARETGVLDHIFVGGGLEWKVYVRIIPNQGGSTVIWAFARPDGLSDEQFENQLDNGLNAKFFSGRMRWKAGKTSYNNGVAESAAVVRSWKPILGRGNRGTARHNPRLRQGEQSDLAWQGRGV